MFTKNNITPCTKCKIFKIDTRYEKYFFFNRNLLLFIIKFFIIIKNYVIGRSLCARCRDKISSKTKELEEDLENQKDPLYEPVNNIYSEETLLPLGISPAKIKKLNYDQREKNKWKSNF